MLAKINMNTFQCLVLRMFCTINVFDSALVNLWSKTSKKKNRFIISTILSRMWNTQQYICNYSYRNVRFQAYHLPPLPAVFFPSAIFKIFFLAVFLSLSTCHAPAPLLSVRFELLGVLFLSPCIAACWACLLLSLSLSLVFPRSPPTWSINTCYRPAGSRPKGERRREREKVWKESEDTENRTPRKRGMRWRKRKKQQKNRR